MESQTYLIPYGKTIYSLRRFILTAKNQSISHSYTKQAQSNSSAIPLVKHQHTPPFSHTPSNARKAVFANTLSGNSRNARS